jgi:predicted metal-dependent hydrolase
MTGELTTTYGSHVITFELIRRDRSTLEITVQPDGTVLVIAPVSAAPAEIVSRVRKRGRWILSQQRYFAQFTPRTPPRRYVPGETHLYLGRQYRLKVQPSTQRKARLVRGFIQIEGVDFDDHASIEQLLTAWYRAHAQVQFQRRLEICQQLFPEPDRFQPASLGLRRMTARWGSMSQQRNLLLNPDLIRAPMDAIDYVITHELCHLAVPNHSQAFYELQGLVMPDWKRRKLRLERSLA